MLLVAAVALAGRESGRVCRRVDSGQLNRHPWNENFFQRFPPVNIDEVEEDDDEDDEDD